MSDTTGQRSYTQEEPIRINRYISMCGVTSRRKADGLIEEGRVSVNGEVLDSFGMEVGPEDVVRVDGERVEPYDLVYALLNKPTDTITTTDDPRGRKTVLDVINGADLEEVGAFPVGRLDRHTTGVLLFTNDGKLAHRLTHPRYEVSKEYRVRTVEPLSAQSVRRLREGVQLEDGPAAADRIEPTSGSSERREWLLELHEGRNRQIRRMIEAIGNSVDELERTEYAGLTAKGLKPGNWRWLEEEEIDHLQQFVN